MIFNMAGYVIQETAEPQTAAPDTETAAELFDTAVVQEY